MKSSEMFIRFCYKTISPEATGSRMFSKITRSVMHRLLIVHPFVFEVSCEVSVYMIVSEAIEKPNLV